MDLLTWLLIGLIAGSLTYLLDSSSKENGFLGTIILGVLGALVGGLIANLIFQADTVTGFNLPSFIVALVGSIGLLGLSRAVRTR